MKSASSFALGCLIVLAGSVSQAAVYISCGKGEPLDDMTYGAGQEFEISSGTDQFEGPVAGTWELKLKDSGDWMAANKRIRAYTSKNEAGDVVVEVVVATRRSITGRVGSKYILTDVYSDTPSLKKYNLGGFAGDTLTGQYTCVSAID